MSTVVGQIIEFTARQLNGLLGCELREQICDLMFLFSKWLLAL
jgi:hypothetical protein